MTYTIDGGDSLALNAENLALQCVVEYPSIGFKSVELAEYQEEQGYVD
jgi:hypothetical protein